MLLDLLFLDQHFSFHLCVGLIFLEKIENPVQEVPQTNGEAMDVRREPPIPIERNADPATVRPAVKEILSPIESLKGTAQPIEPGKSVISDETKSFDDRQRRENILDSGDQHRNDNLIDSDAIKKEESELAAAAVQANVEPAASYEKLRQTLEKHKLEQMEMMQEQKKLLKVIKEQAQVLEMEKKRLAMEQTKRKDEGEPNKSPAQARILDEGTLTDPSGKIKSVINGVESPMSNGASPNDSLRSRDSRGPILNALTNWTSRRNETRDQGPKKPLEFALPIALQMRNQTNAEEKSSLTVKDSADRENASLTVMGKIHREGRSSLTAKGDDRKHNSSLPVKDNSDREDNPSLMVKGNSDPKDSPSSAVKANAEKKSRSSLTAKGKSNHEDNPSLTVKENSDQDGGPSLMVEGNADREDRPAMRRDILEQADRDKREKRDVTDEIFPERKFDVGERPVDECRRKVDEIKEPINIPTTDIISIKTNVYLADQGFADKKVTLDPGDGAAPADEVSSGLSMLKKRDLKALTRERQR